MRSVQARGQYAAAESPAPAAAGDGATCAGVAGRGGPELGLVGSGRMEAHLRCLQAQRRSAGWGVEARVR
jgi:hypothetical protein